MKHKIIVLKISVILLLLIVSSKYHYEQTAIFDCDVIEISDISEVLRDKKEMKNEVELSYDDYKIPIIDDGVYLLSQGNTDNYKGSLFCDGYKILIIAPKKTKKELMSNNEGLNIILYNDTQFKFVEIKMTSLPVVNLEPISYEYDYYRDKTEYEIITGKLQVINPRANYSKNTKEIYEGFVKYRIRGAGTRAFPKHSYKLNLINKDGNKIDQSLLGMREDDDWFLNAMYLDDSKIREKISYDLSNYINFDVEYKNEYVELIIDSDYKGLYLLQEPIDYKTFGLDKNNSIMYSIKQPRTQHNVLLSNEIFDTSRDIIDEFEIELNERTDYREAIDVLRCIINDLDGVENSLKINYNVENFINYQLILNMISATDNSYKNQIFFVRRNDNDYYFYKIVWDLDISLLENTYNSHNVEEMIDDSFIPKEIKNSTNYINGIKTKYQLFRKQFYNLDNIYDLLNSYCEIIEQSGAIIRDSENWGNSEYSKTKTMIYNYFEERIKILDEYYDYGG